ncbi:iron-containing alcohol dehydrogenase [Pseudoclavibacter sp. AY1H1]|uniref:iron-containing alcohol dehydrogenase n=1 Tax=Pseudoclavibacter sp. AY1H1 TaxID=2080584 RepID=UPI000CE805D7|nr:iron-containing alcohol dehydrogenase [Pseudoclavibacter sp. AY1H1]PPF36549.1 3-dehydroquinate synthase [Pseudoclavibacter sp. AY1H1]
MTAALQAYAFEASGGKLRVLRYEADVRLAVGRVLRDLGVPDGADVALLADSAQKLTSTGELGEEVTAALAAGGYLVRRPALEIGGHGLVLDEATVASAASAVDGARAVVTVGSGTVTDLGKAVAPAGVLLVAVQSAPSVNGFADSLSVLVRGGAKSTTPTRWPDALLIDADALDRSPARLVAAGVGDAVAIGCSGADWLLASALQGTQADAAALVPIRDAVARLAAGAHAPGAMPALVDALTVGGLIIGALGTTAPLSGNEHLLSHILDMSAMAQDQPHDLHGAQVGVATVLSAALWDVALSEGLVRLAPGSAYPDDLEERVSEVWSRVDASGRLGATCAANVERKRALWQGGDGLAPGVLAEVRAQLVTPEAVVGTLRAWGAPTRLRELTPPVDAETARWALSALPFMRDRLTLADLLVVGGAWTDEFLDKVIARADAAGGGL